MAVESNLPFLAHIIGIMQQKQQKEETIKAICHLMNTLTIDEVNDIHIKVLKEKLLHRRKLRENKNKNRKKNIKKRQQEAKINKRNTDIDYGKIPLEIRMNSALSSPLTDPEDSYDSDHDEAYFNSLKLEYKRTLGSLDNRHLARRYQLDNELDEYFSQNDAHHQAQLDSEIEEYMAKH